MTERDSFVTAITDKVIDVLYGRGGFDHWWDDIDDEIKDEIKEEIADVLMELVP